MNVIGARSGNLGQGQQLDNAAARLGSIHNPNCAQIEKVAIYGNRIWGREMICKRAWNVCVKLGNAHCWSFGVS